MEVLNISEDKERQHLNFRLMLIEEPHPNANLMQRSSLIVSYFMISYLQLKFQLTSSCIAIYMLASKMISVSRLSVS